MAVHVAYVTPTPVINGVPIDKSTATIKEMMVADTEMRMVPDDDIPNTASKPTVKDYIEAENGDGYSVKSLTNTMVITES
ncbi:MAG: hypothetical protein GF411_13860 [Candidatus Lokiarchaeota archaeon]|nr:hypothetical protein [Candidatus Lokiarchaeota archaeon]